MASENSTCWDSQFPREICDFVSIVGIHGYPSGVQNTDVHYLRIHKFYCRYSK